MRPTVDHTAFSRQGSAKPRFENHDDLRGIGNGDHHKAAQHTQATTEFLMEYLQRTHLDPNTNPFWQETCTRPMPPVGFQGTLTEHDPMRNVSPRTTQHVRYTEGPPRYNGIPEAFMGNANDMSTSPSPLSLSSYTSRSTFTGDSALPGLALQYRPVQTLPTIIDRRYYTNISRVQVPQRIDLDPIVSLQSPLSALNINRPLVSPITPVHTSSPKTPGYATQKGRHHRTATPEQRQLRALTNGAPIYTIGMEPQADRGLLCDFFEDIKAWCNTYAIRINTLNLEQFLSLMNYPILTDLVNNRDHLSTLVTQLGMLNTIVSSIITRHICTHTISDDALTLSSHPAATICADLLTQWNALGTHEHEAKDALLNTQRDIYKHLSTAPDHRTWRTSAAQTLASTLLQTYSSFLQPLPLAHPTISTERTHRLQELIIKGHRISFRLRSAAVKWIFEWPVPGSTFDAENMVIENRGLYGDVLRTLNEVQGRPEAHEVVFGTNCVVRKGDFGVGGERWIGVLKGVVVVGRRE